MSKKKCIIDRYDTVYDWTVYVIANPDKNILDKHFEWKNEEEKSVFIENCTYDAYTNTNVYDKDNKKYCIVVIFNHLHKNIPEDVNTCSHEAFHVTSDILKSAGVKLSADSEEAFAYLQGWLTERMFKTVYKAYE